MNGPKVGTRTDDAKPLEWTGSVWAPVCPPCGKPMADYDERGWLCCGACGLLATNR